MGVYALVKKGTVINTIVWDGPDASPMDFGKAVTYAEIPDGDGNSPSIGWSYDGKAFSPPPLTDEEVAAQKQSAIDANSSLRQSLLDEATSKITVWQTKLLIGRKLTDTESASLNAWLDYIDELDAIDANTDQTISWPNKPS